MQRSLATSSVDCARLIDRLASLLHDPECESRSALLQKAIEDQSGRFRIWAGNLGAFQHLPSPASLDHRLRESPKIATQIQELLEDLQDSLQTITAIASGERPNRQYDSDDTEDSDSFEDYEDAKPTDAGGETKSCFLESKELFESVKETVASLFRISIIIRKGSPRDRFAKALSSKQSPFNESFDIGHVGHKFPLLNSDDRKWLKERLGKAITQRRMFLSYARDHRHRLGKEPTDLWQPDATERPTIPIPATDWGGKSQSGHTNLTKPASTLAPTAASTLRITDMQLLETDFHDDQSQTSYALSLGDDDDDSNLQLPRFSDVSKGESTFECPLCWTIQTIRKETSWRKHGFSDLRPYVCTFERCDVKLFADRRDWFEHELEQHRVQWHCRFCEKANFSSLERFQKHLRLQHAQDVTDDQLDALTEASKRPIDRMAALDCPFCDEWEAKLRESNPDISAEETIVVTPSQFRQHVGSHMQQLALFAIPRGYLEGDADADSFASIAAARVAKDKPSDTLSPSGSFASLLSARSNVALSRTGSEHNRIQTFNAQLFAQNLQNSESQSSVEQKLIATLPSLLPEELSQLSSHINLETLILEHINPRLQNIARATCLGPWGSEAFWISEPQYRLDVWSDFAMQVLGGHTNMDLQMIKKAFGPHNNSIMTLEECVKKNCEQSTGAHVLGLTTLARHGREGSAAHISDSQIDTEVQIVRNAIEQKTDLIAGRSLMTSFVRKSDHQLRQLLKAYNEKYSNEESGPSDLFVDISSAFPHFQSRFMRFMLNGARDKAMRDANFLRYSLDVIHKLSTSHPDYYPRIDLLGSQLVRHHWKRRHLAQVKRIYEQLYGHSLQSAVHGVLEGIKYYRSFFLGLLNADKPLGYGRDTEDDQDDSQSFDGRIRGLREDSLRQPSSYDHMFRWEQPAEEVFITGTFDNWSKSIKLEKQNDVFCKIVKLPWGKHRYKFIVDGNWETSGAFPTELDNFGNICHVCSPENFEYYASSVNLFDLGSTESQHVSQAVTSTPASATMKLDTEGKETRIAEPIDRHAFSQDIQYGHIQPMIGSKHAVFPKADPAPQQTRADDSLLELDLFGGASPNPSSSSDLNAHFVNDVIPDGTVISSGQNFTQAWTLSNPGPRAWPAGCSVSFVGGDNMLNIDETRLLRGEFAIAKSNVVSRPVEPGEVMLFHVMLKAPSREGTAISYWRLKTADGTPFGHRLWCEVKIVNSTRGQETKSAESIDRHTFLQAVQCANADSDRIEVVLRALNQFCDTQSAAGFLNTTPFLEGRDSALDTLPLHETARFGNVPLAKLLVEHGADINAKTASRDTPLSIAVRYDKLAFVEFLLENGADEDSTRSVKFAHMKYLIQIKEQYGHGWFDFLDAGKNIPGRIDIVREILGNCPHPTHIVNTVDGRGLSAINIATYYDDIQIARLLLEPGDWIDIHTMDLAVVRCSVHCLELLLGRFKHTPKFPQSLAGRYNLMRLHVRRQRKAEGLPPLPTLEDEDFVDGSLHVSEFVKTFDLNEDWDRVAAYKLRLPEESRTQDSDSAHSDQK